MTATPLEIAEVAARTADDKKASDVMVLDISSLTDVADYFVICTAANNPLKDLIVEQVEAEVKKKCGVAPTSVEGRANDGWVLLDYGNVVVHVMKPETRDYYRIERLWGDAPRVHLGLESEYDDGLGPGTATREASVGSAGASLKVE
jgi:ribosome-associated protein